MNVYPKRLVRCDSTSDIISNLPSHILDNIMICLPIEEAARTSVLSKKWRFKWHYIPQLVFDRDYFLRHIVSRTPKENWFQIFQVLSLHRGPLCRFVLSLSAGWETACCFIDQLIFLLTGKDVQKVTLSFPLGTKYRTPSTLFQCIHLTHLDISNCVFILPPEFVGFCKLVSVELRLDNLSANDFKNFMSKCPLLQQLRLEIIGGLQLFEIDAPNLKFLHFSGVLNSVLLKKVPLVSTLIIDDSSRPFFPRGSTIADIFGSLPAIEHLSAGGRFLWYLSAGVLPERLPSINHLKHVELSGFCCTFYKAVQCVLLLMKSSPNLRKLKIIKVLSNPYQFLDDRPALRQLYKSQTQVRDSYKLREVEMEDFNGTKFELEFLKLVLAKSPVLEKITIQPPKGISSDKGLEILMAVTRLKRASPDAELIFLVGD